MFDKIKAFLTPGWQVRGIVSLVAGAVVMGGLNRFVSVPGGLNLVGFVALSGGAFYLVSKKWPTLFASKH